jgi:hypothetical protein
MKIAQIVNGEVANYPANMSSEFPNTSFPNPIVQSCLPDGYTMVAQAPTPAAPWYQSPVEGTPALVNGVWTQSWVPTTNYTTVAAAQAANVMQLSSACAAAIVSGFTSSALGSAYTYPSKATDQANLSASVLASLLPNLPAEWTTPFWCADSNGNWAFVNHTAAQIQQVGQDGKAAILALQAQNATLAAQVNAAATIDAALAVTWSAPAS